LTKGKKYAIIIITKQLGLAKYSTLKGEK